MQRYTEHYVTPVANKALLEQINNRISTAIGEPWGQIKEAVNGNLAFLPIPHPDGFVNAETENRFTQQAILRNVNLVGVAITEFDINWLPQQTAQATPIEPGGAAQQGVAP